MDARSDKCPEPMVQMINIKNGITIYKPVGLVFDFMTTPGNNFQWQYGTLESYSLADGSADDGSRFRSIGHLMGRRNVITFKVTKNTAGEKIRLPVAIRSPSVIYILHLRERQRRHKGQYLDPSQSGQFHPGERGCAGEDDRKTTEG